MTSSVPVPANEVRRKVALDRLGILDTPIEERFDRLTRLVAAAMDAPIALVSLVDTDRQWFKSRVGLAAQETSRELAFCAHAIADDTNPFFVVEDATKDPRFAGNPLVTDAPGIRFYAGRVLRDNQKYALGTLCVIDRVPRTLTDAQLAILDDLGAIAEQELCREKTMDLLLRLDESERRKSVILDTLAEGLILQDADGGVSSWNPAAEQLLGLSRVLDGDADLDLATLGFVDDTGAPLPDTELPGAVAIRTGQQVREIRLGIVGGESTTWLRANATPIIREDGLVEGALTAFRSVG